MTISLLPAPASGGTVPQAAAAQVKLGFGLICFLSSVFHQKVAKTAAVDRLTDASRYTGSHKERFDESGKGKGREGREELVDNTGYVGAYKNAGTYDTKTQDEK